MSHFTCIVFGDNPEEQLKPFQEGLVEYKLTPIQLVAEKIGKRNMENISDKELLRFLRAMTNDKEMVAIVHPDQTSEAHMREIAEADISIVISFDDKGKTHVVHKRNYDNSKWDWYEVGGRWAGMLLPKAGVWHVPAVQTASYLKKAARWPEFKPVYSGGCNSLLKKEIDIPAMEEQAVLEHMVDFDKYSQFKDGFITRKEVENRVSEDIQKGLIVLTPPEEVAKEYDLRNTHKSHIVTKLGVIHDLYWNQPCIKKATEVGLDWWTTDELIVCYFFKTRDEYEAVVRARAFCPYSFVKDGVWYQRGQMGWFGMSKGDEDEAAWNKRFRAAFDEAPDNTLITVVDCHI